MINPPVLKKYLLPGLVFQSVLIGGGYGTGRELVEFFLNHGPLDGLLGMLVSVLIWCAVCVVTYELARVTRAYDYRTFSRQLLGSAWGFYEACYLLLMILVLAVIAASAGSILRGTFGVPYYVGVIAMMACIGFLVFKGSSAIEKFLSIWSLVLYTMYFVLFCWSIYRYGGDILTTLFSAPLGTGWLVGGVEYAGYNIIVLPALLFSVRHVERRKEAVLAGLLTGPIGMVPGVLFFLCLLSQYPQVIGQTVPANYLLESLGSKGFQYAFQTVLLGTLIETGTGVIHGFNERLAGVFDERKRPMPALLRPAVGLLLLVACSIVARFGLIDLVAKGYGTATWGGLLVFVIPVLTVGAAKIYSTSPPRSVPK